MVIFNLIKQLENISLKIPTKILRLKGYTFLNNKKVYLELIIFKGFSSSTTHEIEFDLEKNVLNLEIYFNKGELLNAPLSSSFNKVIKETDNIELFLNENYWS